MIENSRVNFFILYNFLIRGSTEALQVPYFRVGSCVICGVIVVYEGLQFSSKMHVCFICHRIVKKYKKLF